MSFDFFYVLLIVLEDVEEIALYVEAIPLVVERVHHQLLIAYRHQCLALRLILLVIPATAFTLWSVILFLLHHGV